MGKKWALAGSKVGPWLNARRKALVALIVPTAAFLTANGILDIDPAYAAAIAVVLGAGAVERTENK